MILRARHDILLVIFQRRQILYVAFELSQQFNFDGLLILKANGQTVLPSNSGKIRIYCVLAF
jgi:hypothetical protein